jgi:hypothetical protein
VERRLRGVSTAILVLLHYLFPMTHFVPPERQPTIRRERREQRTEHLPEQTLSATQPQAPIVEQAPPALPGLADDGAGWIATLNHAFFPRRWPVLPMGSDDWVPTAPVVLPGLIDGAGWMSTLNTGFFQRRQPVLPMGDDWVPTPLGQRPDQHENKK